MDTTAGVTTPEIAKILGVSLPAAHHALDSVGIPRTGRGRVRVADPEVVQELLARRGRTPDSTLPPTRLRVLAALSFSPLGLRSARSVATKARVSPTTATRTLARLAEDGYVERREVTAARGRARRESRWFANSDRWPPDVREAVRHTRLPLRPAERTPLPDDLRHFFWNVEPSELDRDVDGSFIAGRLLASPDLRGWAWVMSNISRENVEKAVSRRGVDERTRAFVRNWWAHGA